MRRVGVRHTKIVEVKRTSIYQLSEVLILAFGYEPNFLVKKSAVRIRSEEVGKPISYAKLIYTRSPNRSM